jgi:hypothetical protein
VTGCCPRHLLSPDAGPCDWGPATVELEARFPASRSAARFVALYGDKGAAYAGMTNQAGRRLVTWTCQVDFEDRARESGATPALERAWVLDCLLENAGYVGSAPHGPKAELRWREPGGEWSPWRSCPPTW